MDNTRIESINISNVPPKNVFSLLQNVKLLSKLSLDYLISFSVEYIEQNALKLRFNKYNDDNMYYNWLCKLKLKELLNISEEDMLNSVRNVDNRKYNYLEDEVLIEYENNDENNYNKNKKKFLKQKYEFLYYNNFPIDSYTKYTFKDAIIKCVRSRGQLDLNNIRYTDNQSDYDFLCYNLRSIFIREISITHTKIDDKGFKYFCRNFKNTPFLSSLYITYDYISDQGMLYFNEYSRYIPFLTRLDLKSNFITDLGVRYICECLSHISSLQYLRLDDNECITDESINLLIECFKYIPELRALEIYQNDITEEGAELLDDALDRLPKFEKVDNAIPVSGLLNSIDENDSFNLFL